MAPNKRLVEGVDFYIDKDTKKFVLTKKFLLERGWCCSNGCRHCPYGFVPDKKKFVVLGIEKNEPKK